jgi:hypothetical protein
MITPINVSINPHIDSFCELPEIWMTYDRKAYKDDMFPEDHQCHPEVMFPELNNVNNVHVAYFTNENNFLRYVIKHITSVK